MRQDHAAQAAERRNVQRATQATRQPDAQAARGAGQVAAPPAALLGNLRLNGRGNAPVQAALLLQMQQTHGNRAVQRFLNAPRTGATTGATAIPMPAIQRQPPAGEAPPSDADPAIEALNLEPDAKEGAKALKQTHPEIGFTSGRRSWTGQAHAMAQNVAQTIAKTGSRKWIQDTYKASSSITKLQGWVDDHPDATKVDEIFKGLKATLEAMSPTEQGRVSKHPAGLAFDVQPQSKDAAQIKADMQALAKNSSDFRDNEGGLVRWHLQFKRLHPGGPQHKGLPAVQPVQRQPAGDATKDTKKQAQIKKAIDQATLSTGETDLVGDLRTYDAGLSEVEKELVDTKKKLTAMGYKRKKDGSWQEPKKKGTLEEQQTAEKLQKAYADATKKKSDLETKLTAERASLRKDSEDALAKYDMEQSLKKSGQTPEQWFGKIVPNATFFGVPIGTNQSSKVGGAHQELVDRLAKAESYLRDKLKCTNNADCVTKLGLKDISGLRQPSPAVGGNRPSLHSFGLAVDINYTGSPYVGLQGKKGQKVKDHISIQVIGRAMRLVHGKIFNMAATRIGSITEIWKETNEASQALKTYLNLRNDPGLADYVKKLPKEPGDPADVAGWKDQIEKDYAALWDESKGVGKGDFAAHTDPAQGGFMDLQQELVEGLVDPKGGGLYWGGQYPDPDEGGAAKDIMHFDWRGGTIQRSLQRSRGAGSPAAQPRPAAASSPAVQRQPKAKDPKPKNKAEDEAGWADAAPGGTTRQGDGMELRQDGVLLTIDPKSGKLLKPVKKDGTDEVVWKEVGWNEAEIDITLKKTVDGKTLDDGTIRRIPIETPEVGNENSDAARDAPFEGKGTKVGEVTKESAIHKAIVYIPASLDTKTSKEPVDILLHLHGYGPGDCQRAIDRSNGEPGMKAGTVRDVEVDLIPQQLMATVNPDKPGAPLKRRMIAVLPQGAIKSEFGQFDSNKYLDVVFKKLFDIKALDSKTQKGSVVLSGHSGAGNLFGNILEGSGQKRLPHVDQQNPDLRITELVLFDSINFFNCKDGKCNESQLDAVWHWVKENLDKDLLKLQSLQADEKRDEYLKNTGMKFRGYYTKEYTSAYTKLRNYIRDWFTTNKTPLEALGGNGKWVKALKANYYVIDAPLDSSHEAGLGKPQKSLGGQGALKDALNP